MTLQCWLQQARAENKKAIDSDEVEIIDEETFESMCETLMDND